ncbi:hypothetical protein [Thermoleptolyngbya sp. M55_K2018_002]|uniref:hypothetical protein n=1 Tax=Thermoleptolyngbya sp. M55_K2018_002 TaxID=2747808 RepID=UPI001A0232E6|nr:hypothetical protein [Thermoleptolyngbya sp. M55_K2018_002]HIK42779.1 hypothetical protein [Thermoleptolyngbya sp. M55_K2018_002]
MTEQQSRYSPESLTTAGDFCGIVRKLHTFSCISPHEVDSLLARSPSRALPIGAIAAQF